MTKIIDLNKTVYELVTSYPEIANIMADLGFSEIKKKVILQSVGKLTTIPKGAKMKNIPMDKIITAFKSNGFEVIGVENQADTDNKTENTTTESVKTDKKLSNTELIKSYLKRLGDKEDLESVRADFVKNFTDVDSLEIMKAEQELMNEGTPIEEVQKLCDVHSALFHGCTTHEQRPQIKIDKQALESAVNGANTKENKIDILIATEGHVLYTFTKENDNLATLLSTTKSKIEKQEDVTNELKQLREVSIHYAKKGDLLYPLLKVKYDISGPSNVMWGVDDEIRMTLSELEKEDNHNAEWYQKLTDVAIRMEEMVYKEANILFPICVEHFTDAEWQQIYRDSKDYSECLGVKKLIWQEGEISTENISVNTSNISVITENNKITMPGGYLTVEQLTALLNTIPMEITFVDAENINCFFNEGEKLFKRPSMAIGREVFSCHPPKIEVMVRQIIDDFRNNRNSRIPIWMEKEDKTMLVTYTAVRDRNGKYLGTVELVQDMTEAKEYFTNKK